MADKVPMEFSPYMGPDATRQASRLMKNLFDLHTNRYKGREDINGSQYEGTAENWGSELLLEARKILLDKPSLKNIFIENTMDFYFDITYSGFTNTYDQENMLCALLKKDVLLSNRTYRIKFTNVEHVWIPRSQSSSDPDVYSDEFIHTTDTPILIVEKEDNSIDEIPLKLTDVDGETTHYYFHIGIETMDMFDLSTYPDENNIFITYPITDSMNGRACIWMCINLLKTFPPVIMENNSLQDKPFLSIGTDGHDRSMLYPLLNFSSEDIDVTHYIIKIVPVNVDSFVENVKAEANYTSTIGEIHLLEYENGVPSMTSGNPIPAPTSDTVITYNHDYIKMTLYKKAEGETNYNWNFKTPKSGDYDYDGSTYRNKCYAWLYLSVFNNNTNDTDISVKKVPLIYIRFNDDAYLSAYEGLCENAVSGVHVDVTSDYSNNGVSKKNGTIHNMGDFDGLPSYFKIMIPDTIHRAHLEAYAIRDKLNKRNQSAMDKQTAGILIDSAVPQNEVQKIDNNMPVVIYYDWDNQFDRKYTYNREDPNISKTNNLTEIAYIDENNFGNSKMSKYKSLPKFVYHGNRHFSLGMMGFDPELETGRVYIISNDPAIYENNEITRNQKAPVTFARMCDIPTDFLQLTNIKGVAPTVIIDPEYIRTICCFSDDDKNALYNLTNTDHCLSFDFNGTHSFIWPTPSPPSDMNVESLMDDKFARYIHLNDTIDISDNSTVQFDISNGGSGYDVDDEFKMFICGICLKGIVKTVSDGVVTSFKFLPDETDNPPTTTPRIVRSNIGSSTSVYSATTTHGSGSGLQIRMVVDSFIWDNTEMQKSQVSPKYVPNVWAFYLDPFGNIWIYQYGYDETVSGDRFLKLEQITGATIYENTNDSGYKSPSKYKFKDVFLNNLIRPITNKISQDIHGGHLIPYTYLTQSLSDVLSDDDRIFTTEDMSDYINSSNKNTQDALFVYGQNNQHSIYKRLLSYRWGYIAGYGFQNPMAVEMYQDLNVPEYYNKTNKLKHFLVDGSQPKLFLFDPLISSIDTYTQISKDVSYVSNSKPFLLSDIIMDLDNDYNLDLYGPIPEIVTNNDGEFILTRNVYINDEYDDSDIVEKRHDLEVLTREVLADRVKHNYPESIPAKYEGTPYAYSKEMLIDFFMKNNMPKGRSAGNPGFKYTEGPESIYRRPLVRLFRTKGDTITDRFGLPVGEQPTGAFKEVSTEVFNTNVKIDTATTTAKPWNVFRIDTDGSEDINLNGFRMYDELNNDISDSTLLIIDGTLYVSHITPDGITWVKINRNI